MALVPPRALVEISVHGTTDEIFEAFARVMKVETGNGTHRWLSFKTDDGIKVVMHHGTPA